MKVKYIKTEDNKIIVFSGLQNHFEFRSFNPISAGFISFSAKGGMPNVQCYGKSVSLKMESDSNIDSELARRQILGYDY